MTEDKEAWRRRLVEELFSDSGRGLSRPATTAGLDRPSVQNAPPDPDSRSELASAKSDAVTTAKSPPSRPADRVSDGQPLSSRSLERGSVWHRYAVGAVLTTAGVIGGVLLDRAYFDAAPPPAKVTGGILAPAVAPHSALTAMSVKQALCSDPPTSEGLKAVVFGQARRLGGPNPAWLEAVLSTATLHVDGAHLKALTTASAAAVCTGELALQLPQTTNHGTPDMQLPLVEVDYSVLPATDARRRAYTLDGATLLVRKLVELEPEPALKPQSPSASAASSAAGHDSRSAPGSSAVVKLATRSSVRATKAVPVRRHPETGGQVQPVKARSALIKHRQAAAMTTDSNHGATRAEQMIGNDASLRALDNDVALLSSTPNNRVDAHRGRTIAKMQATFLARRDRCATSECIVRAYRQHIDALARLRHR